MTDNSRTEQISQKASAAKESILPVLAKALSTAVAGVTAAPVLLRPARPRSPRPRPRTQRPSAPPRRQPR